MRGALTVQHAPEIRGDAFNWVAIWLWINTFPEGGQGLWKRLPAINLAAWEASDTTIAPMKRMLQRLSSRRCGVKITFLGASQRAVSCPRSDAAAGSSVSTPRALDKPSSRVAPIVG